MRTWISARPALLALILALAVSASAPARAEADGQALFAKTCQKCHGPDGKADTPAGKKMKVPAWSEPIGTDEVVQHVRTHKKHKQVSKKVSDPELEAIAAYVASLTGS